MFVSESVTSSVASNSLQSYELQPARILCPWDSLHKNNGVWNARLDEALAGIKIVRRSINNLRYADDTTLMTECKEELKSLLKVKEESEKSGLKLNIQKTKIMAPGPITSW